MLGDGGDLFKEETQQHVEKRVRQVIQEIKEEAASAFQDQFTPLVDTDKRWRQENLELAKQFPK